MLLISLEDCLRAGKDFPRALSSVDERREEFSVASYVHFPLFHNLAKGVSNRSRKNPLNCAEKN